MAGQVATIEKIRSAVRALRNSLEEKGSTEYSYNLLFGISFNPTGNLDADTIIKAVESNRKVSPNLTYAMQAELKKQPALGVTKATAVEMLSKFDEELATLPQEAGANMRLEFTVSNPHEKDIIENAQKAISIIEKPEPVVATAATVTPIRRPG